jgi:RNA-directed DNA polymerase
VCGSSGIWEYVRSDQENKKKMKKTDVDAKELYHGYCSCRKRKRSTIQEQEFSINITKNITQLRSELLYGTYKPQPIRSFLVYKPVLREIFAPEFRDRVDQHYFSEKLEPLLEKELIYDCYSCRKGKGTTFGINRLKRFIAQCSANFKKDCYVLLGDIKGYFMSIFRPDLWDRLKKFVEEKYHGIDKEKFLWQLETFLFHSPLDNTIIRGDRKKWGDLPNNKSLFACAGAPKPNEFTGMYTADMDVNGRGLTIGALPAQMLANFFLNPFDHHCKSGLKLRFYGRYVDDFFIVHTNKEFLLNIVKDLRAFLKEMGLELHPDKIQILHYKQGIPFLGAIIKGKALLPGKRIRGGIRNLFREIDSLDESIKYSPEIEDYTSRINSYLGMMRQFNAKQYVRNMIDRHPKIKRFFILSEENQKAISIRKVMRKKHETTWKFALRQYHEQFRKRYRTHPFLSKEDLYYLIYHQLYT